LSSTNIHYSRITEYLAIFSNWANV